MEIDSFEEEDQPAHGPAPRVTRGALQGGKEDPRVTVRFEGTSGRPLGSARRELLARPFARSFRAHFVPETLLRHRRPLDFADAPPTGMIDGETRGAYPERSIRSGRNNK
ncbi:hypothetical protein KM043_008178 [Ampulex compressa]|nr:hypothetical protein KM043_008178 [Ampulex compressa]